MNAKELHDLYAPLWARCPDTRPKHVDDERSDIPPVPVELHPSYEFDGAITSFLWCYPDRFDEDDPTNLEAYEGVGTVEAAALCRVAVEDWLIAHYRHERIRAAGGPTKHDLCHLADISGSEFDRISDASGVDPGERGDVPYDQNPFRDFDLSVGPTIHDAIVAAAQAVLDAKAKALP